MGYTTEPVRIISTGGTAVKKASYNLQASVTPAPVLVQPRRMAVPAADLAASAARRRPDLSSRLPPAKSGRARSGSPAWRSSCAGECAPAVERASHRRDLAHAQRPARAARRLRTVRARAQPALPRQHRAVGRLRGHRAAALARAGRSSCCSPSNITRSCAGKNGCSTTRLGDSYRAVRRARSRGGCRRGTAPAPLRVSRHVLVAPDVLQRTRHAHRDRSRDRAAAAETQNVELMA